MLFVVAITPCFSQPDMDSVVIHRNNAFKEFRMLYENSDQQLWIINSKIVEKAKEVIEADNTLINEYLFREIDRNRKLEDKVEKLSYEISLAKKETELQYRIVEDNKYFTKTLLLFIGALIVVLLVFLVLFIDRQIRFRSIKLEMERIWPVREELDKDESLQQEIMKLNKQVGELTLKNSSLLSENHALKSENIENQERLENEKKSKKKFEEEIKNLISQIKSA